MTLQPLKSQVSQLSAGTICSIARDVPMFSLMNCAEYTNSERIHSAFTAYVQTIETKVSVWQDAWASLLEFATTVMLARVSITRTNHQRLTILFAI